MIYILFVTQFILGLYIGYKIGHFKGQLKGFSEVIIYVALNLRKVHREVDTIPNGPYVVNRMVNLLSIEEVYELTDKEPTIGEQKV